MSNHQGNEIEVKFLVRDLKAIERQLQSYGSQWIQQRVFEANLRFDTAELELTNMGRVLRLRQDTASRMTYKDPAKKNEEVSVRREIEFEVSNFDAAREFLEVLGYQVSMTYEKYRAIYRVVGQAGADSGLLVTLDNMPFGDFIEIEGPDAAAIRNLAEELGLNWEERCLESYMALFMRLREEKNLEVQNLSFSDFEGLSFSASDFHLNYADE